MLMLEPASDRVNFLLGHSLVLAQLKTSYIELDMRLMSTSVGVGGGIGGARCPHTKCSSSGVGLDFLFFFIRHRNNGNGNRKLRTHVTRGKERKE